MSRRMLFVFFVLSFATLFTACKGTDTDATSDAAIPNPASVYCEEQGGTVELREDESGDTLGICHFADGSECEEWAYYRAECAPEGSVSMDETSSEGWSLYRNAEMGYRFEYPAGCEIVPNDDPLHGFSVTGSEVWPEIYISHPTDRDEYQPPDDENLESWLIDHSLLMTGGDEPSAETRQPDVQIAGITTIHTRFNRSPQSFAYDKYFFARAQQLYVIVILHTNDQEDWALYQHFLDSIQFGN